MGHPNKINGSAPSLDVRISSALASGDVDKAELIALLAEAEQALGMVQTVITAETPRLHDLSNTNPDASLDLINRSKLRAERLELAIPRLRERLKAIELYEYRQAMNEHFDYHKKVRDSLAAELAKLYEPFLAHITDLFARIDKNTAAISDLHARAAAIGENRRLLDVELVARGLDSYDARHPRLRESLKLPKWDRSSEIAFPSDPMVEWNQYAARSHAAMAKRMAEKGALATGPDWAAGRELQIQQEEAAFTKRAEELKAADTKSKVEYEAKLQEAERRRLGGV